MRILVFGNPHLPDDSLALEVSKELSKDDSIQHIEFKHSENLNDLLEENYDAILDVAYGVPKVVVLDDLEKLREHKLVSLHDYDVAFFLKLMKAMGKLDKVNIIAIPITYDKQTAVRETKSILTQEF